MPLHFCKSFNFETVPNGTQIKNSNRDYVNPNFATQKRVTQIINKYLSQSAPLTKVEVNMSGPTSKNVFFDSLESFPQTSEKSETTNVIKSSILQDSLEGGLPTDIKPEALQFRQELMSASALTDSLEETTKPPEVSLDDTLDADEISAVLDSESFCDSLDVDMSEVVPVKKRSRIPIRIPRPKLTRQKRVSFSDSFECSMDVCLPGSRIRPHPNPGDSCPSAKRARMAPEKKSILKKSPESTSTPRSSADRWFKWRTQREDSLNNRGVDRVSRANMSWDISPVSSRIPTRTCVSLPSSFSENREEHVQQEIEQLRKAFNDITSKLDILLKSKSNHN